MIMIIPHLDHHQLCTQIDTFTRINWLVLVYQLIYTTHSELTPSEKLCQQLDRIEYFIIVFVSILL